MYSTLAEHLFWSQMANVVITSMRDCRWCIQEELATKCNCNLQYFLGPGCFKLVARDILWALKETSSDIQDLASTTNRYSKPTSLVPIALTTWRYLTNVIFHSSVQMRGIPAYILKEEAGSSSSSVLRRYQIFWGGRGWRPPPTIYRKTVRSNDIAARWSKNSTITFQNIRTMWAR